MNRFMHRSHWNGRSPVCIRMWMSRYGLRQNAAGHCRHWNGRPCTTYAVGLDICWLIGWLVGGSWDVDVYGTKVG